MYVKGASRRSIKFWAEHLLSTEENEVAQIVDVRGLFQHGDNLKDLLFQMESHRHVSRAKNFMYVASFNPTTSDRILSREEFERALEIFEKQRGIPPGQQRIIVEHTKNGRTHWHVVWNRIDLEAGRAFSDGNDAKVCERAAIEIERALGLEQTPKFYSRDPALPLPKFQAKLWEKRRGERSGLAPDDIKQEITKLYKQSENGVAFLSALQDHGYQSTQGDRALCVVDPAGDVHNLARRIEGVKTKELRAFLRGVDFSKFPTVEAAQTALKEQKRADLESDLELVKVELAREQLAVEGAKAAQEIRAQQEEKNREHSPPPKHLTGIHRAIWTTYQQAGNGSAFEAAIVEQGLILAVVTPEDAKRLNRWERQRLKELEALLPDPEPPNPKRDFPLANTEILTPPSASRAQSKAVWKEVKPKPKQRSDLWFSQEGGYEKLSAELKAEAAEAYREWLEENPKFSHHSLGDYVSFVQKREAERRKANDNEPLYERYKVGELVIVDQFSNAYQLSDRNTGANKAQRHDYFANLDRASLVSETSAESIVKQTRAHWRQERAEIWEQTQDQRRQDKNEQHWEVDPLQPDAEAQRIEKRLAVTQSFGRAANSATDAQAPKGVQPHLSSGTGVYLWDAFNVRHWYREATDDYKEALIAVKQRDPLDVLARLDLADIRLAAVTPEEAERSHRLASFARETGHYVRKYKSGEIVAVLEPSVYRDGDTWQVSDQGPRVIKLNERTTGHTQGEIRRFMGPVAGELKSLTEAKDQAAKSAVAKLEDRKTESEEFQKQIADRRAGRLKELEAWRKAQHRKPARQAVRRGTEEILNAGMKAPLVPIIAADAGLRVLGKAFDVAADAFQSLFSPTLTPEQKAQAQFSEARREDQAQETINWDRYIAQSAAEQRRHETDQAQERERERDRR